MDDKTIIETVYSTTEVLHEVGLISEEVWARVGELSRMQQEVEDIHASVLDHIHVDMVQTYMKEQQTEIERLKAEVDQLKFNRDIDEVGYDGTVMSDE
jgi:uncharacterized small protein (DUF1192 family)